MSTHLAETLVALRAAVADASYPLALPSAPAARSGRAALLGQLDDYLLPRLARLDAPVLVVVGGSTGAGKSTLVNSLVEAPVSAAGVLRPTTRAPVLVSHPSDAQWYRRAGLLPGLARTNAAAPGALQLVAAPALPPGLALLDAPDVDSVVDSNRALAAQLLAAADLWLFVTTAARYADAVPWELLATARDRGAAIALVLDRVPPSALAEVTAHFTEMLTAHGFGGAPLFVVPEVAVGGQGLLPVRVVTPLREWLAGLAQDAGARAAVVRQTVAGAVAAAGRQVAGLATAADDQVTAAQALTERVRSPYASALSTVDSGVRSGTLLRGEVLARWQELVGTGELFSALLARVGRLRDQLTATLTGRAGAGTPGRELKAALESSLTALIATAAADAASHAADGWQTLPWGAALLAEAPRPSGAGSSTGAGSSAGGPRQAADLEWRARRLVRDWQRGVLTMVRAEAAGKRAGARAAAYAVNATGLLVMVGVFASTAFIPTGAEIAVAGGTTIAAQKVLEAIFGDQVLRVLAEKAREDLMTRVRSLLDEDADAFLDRLPALDAEVADRLRSTAEAVGEAAMAANLTPPAVPALAALVPDEDVGNARTASPSVDNATAPGSLVDGAQGQASPVDDARSPASSVDDAHDRASDVDDARRPTPAVDDARRPTPAVDDAHGPAVAVDDARSPASPVDAAVDSGAIVDIESDAAAPVDNARDGAPAVDDASAGKRTGKRTRARTRAVDSEGVPNPTVDSDSGAPAPVDSGPRGSAFVDSEPDPESAVDVASVTAASVDATPAEPSGVDGQPDSGSAVDDASDTSADVDAKRDSDARVDNALTAAPAVGHKHDSDARVDNVSTALPAVDSKRDSDALVDNVSTALPAVDDTLAADLAVEDERDADADADSEPEPVSPAAKGRRS